MNIIEMENVSFQYPNTNKYILEGINVGFEEGKVYGIIGKSGAGKTTILSLLAKMISCTEGKILYRGKGLDELDENEYRARHIGMIFQGYNLIPNATGMENLLIAESIAGKSSKKSREHIYEILGNVGIGKELLHRKVKYLSGGEQQRVAIARAICNDPDILVADEPTSNLDPDTSEAIMKILCDLSKEKNTCVVIVSHAQSVVEKADEVWGLKKGKLLFVE